MKDACVDIHDAKQIFQDTLRFLWLCSVTENSVAPTAIIDTGWHAFILHTRDYASFCDKYLGTFVHHQPHTGDNKPGDNGHSVRLYTSEQIGLHFPGVLMSTNWDGIAATCGADQDGGCDGDKRHTISDQVNCHSKCNGCNDAKCHNSKDDKSGTVLGHGEANIGDCHNRLGSSKIMELQVTMADCDECSGSTNCQS